MIGNGVTSIGDGAFVYCSGLTNIMIGSGVTIIGYGAFEKCSGLTGVTIPDGVTNIGRYAFYDCAGLARIEFEGDASAVGLHAFDGCSPDCVVYVPQGSTGWGVDIPGTWNGLRIAYASDGETPVDGGGADVGTENAVSCRGV